jgi:DNA-binding CsgD family transcriptional regulator/tetratricopeptide (TPR) repeat protein
MSFRRVGLVMAATSPPDLDVPIIGRQREIALLWESVETATRGRLAVALLTGEPGIGKTRLLDAIATRALSAGASVLRGAAFDTEGMPPYLPFLEALGEHIRGTSPSDLRTQTGPLASVLSTILPELPTRLGTLPASYSLPPEQARLRLYEAVATFIAAIADRQPLVLLLDDLQWADPASLDLLRYLARRQRVGQICIVGAYRSGEVAHRQEFERTLAELERLRVLRTVMVGPLMSDDVATMVTLALEPPIDAAISQALYAQSEGNPFFVEELVREWRATGVVVRRDGRWVMTTTEANPAGVSSPSSITRVIQQRLGRLPSEVRTLLRTAAIIGRTFEASLLAKIIGAQPDEVELLLRDVVDAQLLRISGSDTFTFSHDKIRECLSDEVTAAQRRRLHGFVGHALDNQSEPVDAQRLADLTYHFTRSGDRERGAIYARRAAEHALRASAAVEAMTHYQTALRLIEPNDPTRGDFLLGLGEAAVLASAEPQAVVAFEGAEVWFRDRNDTVRAAQAAHLRGLAWWRQEDIARSRTALEAALTLLESGSHPALVPLLVDLGTLLAVSAHQHAAGIAHVQSAMRLAQGLVDPRLLALANRALGNLLVRGNDLASGIPLLEQALALASAADDYVEAAECCACLAPAFFWQGTIERSGAIALQRLAFAEAGHDRYQLRHVYTWLAVCSAIRGHVSEADRRLKQAQAAIEGLESREPSAYLQFTRGAMALMLGDYAAAETHLGNAMTVLRTIGPHALVWYLGFFGMLQALQGKMTAARLCLEELERLLDELPEATMAPGEPVACAAQIALFLGDQPRLERIVPKLAVYRGQFRDLLIDRLLGEIEIRRGNLASAAEYLRAAEATARRESLVWELARTLEAQADLARAEGGDNADQRVRALLEEALALVLQLGNHQEAERLRDRLGVPVALRQLSQLPLGLSPREAEVLRLVASGRSNRAIADELSLSAKTIENHLTSAYGKLGVDNRAAATAFAIRHGLA